MKYLYKLLNRLGILQYFNCTTKIVYNKKKIRIPLIQGIGVTNLNLQPNWFTHLIVNLYKNYSDLEFLDIGANIGQTLIGVNCSAPQWTYLGFEPNGNCIYYINKLIQVNEFKSANIIPIAVSNRNAVMDLHLNSLVDSTATLLDSFRPNHYASGQRLPIVSSSLDELQAKGLLSKPTYLVKIDIEGGESLALEGMTNFLQEKRPIIICEVLDTHSSETMTDHKDRLFVIESLLKELNYEIYQIVRSENDDRITEFKPLVKFRPVAWAEASLKLNDYIFMPKENEIELDSFLLKNLE